MNSVSGSRASGRFSREEPRGPSRLRDFNWARIGMGIFLVVGVVGLWLFLSRHSQMGADPEVFKTVDALYTALRNRDARQLGACEGMLKAQKEGGKLPAAAFATLEKIVGQGHSGDWGGAAERLYGFMMAQRRE